MNAPGEFDERPLRLPLADLSRRTRIGLWLLRLFVTVLTVMVVWAFVVDLSRGSVLP